MGSSIIPYMPASGAIRLRAGRRGHRPPVRLPSCTAIHLPHAKTAMESAGAVSGGIAHRVRLAALSSPDFYPLLLILQAWAAMLVVVNPLGNFPVMDDWAYFASVKALVEHGQLVFSSWAAMNLVS